MVLSLLFIYLILGISKYEIFKKPQKETDKVCLNKLEARCLRAIDGDTIEVIFIGEEKLSDKKEKIRLIGINTPELNLNKNEEAEYWAEQAADFTKEELEGKNIELSFDDISAKKDKYGRYLCYVWIDGYLFNKILIESGNAYYYPDFNFNEKYMKLFEKAEQYARNEREGMWNE